MPALVSKALADTGYDLLSSVSGGWVVAEISGTRSRILVQTADDGVVHAVLVNYKRVERLYQEAKLGVRARRATAPVWSADWHRLERGT